MQTATALLVLPLGFADFNYAACKKTYNVDNQEGLFAYAADSMRKHRDSRAFFTVKALSPCQNMTRSNHLALSFIVVPVMAWGFRRYSQRAPRCRSPPLLNLAPKPKFRRNGGVPNGIQLRPGEAEI